MKKILSGDPNDVLYLAKEILKIFNDPSVELTLEEVDDELTKRGIKYYEGAKRSALGHLCSITRQLMLTNKMNIHKMIVKLADDEWKNLPECY